MDLWNLTRLFNHVCTCSTKGIHARLTRQNFDRFSSLLALVWYLWRDVFVSLFFCIEFCNVTCIVLSLKVKYQISRLLSANNGNEYFYWNIIFSVKMQLQETFILRKTSKFVLLNLLISLFLHKSHIDTICISDPLILINNFKWAS